MIRSVAGLPCQRGRGRWAGRGLAVLAVLALLAACATPPGAPPDAGARPAASPPVSSAASLAAAFAPSAPPGAGSAALQSLARRHRVCAAALALIRGGGLQSVSTAAGCEPAQAPQPDSVFQAASLSKPVFAYAVLKLVQQGRMALDAPVLDYLPQGYRHAFDPLRPGPEAPHDQVDDPRLGRVTVRMLLQHTAGLPNWAGGPLRFESEPGRRWSYSGEGYVLLQRAVESVTGQALDVFMREQVFGPLGMAHSGYRWTPELGAQLLPGHKANGAPRRPVPLREPVAAFSLYTSVGDYARFLVALLHDAPALAQTVAAPVELEAAAALRWGLGWGLEPSAAGDLLWQWGNNPGYRAFAMLAPASGDGLVLLSNGDDGLQLVEPLVQAALPGPHPVLRSAFLSEGVSGWLCRHLGLCL